MPQTNNYDAELWLLIGVLAVFFFILFLIKAVYFIMDFYDELRYLKDEIRRSSGSERTYWVRKKRKLWLSLIPFVKYR